MKPLLFKLSDGTKVYEGDKLQHPDTARVGQYCVAEFEPIGEEVTVRSPSGAVPTVLISELRKLNELSKPILQQNITASEFAHEDSLSEVFTQAAEWLKEHPNERILDVSVETEGNWSVHLYIYHTPD